MMKWMKLLMKVVVGEVVRWMDEGGKKARVGEKVFVGNGGW